MITYMYCTCTLYSKYPPLVCTTVVAVAQRRKEENKIFLIYKEIQKGAIALSYMRKDFLIYEEICKYLVIYERRPLVRYDFATAPF
jgi:hypothetical protein